MIKLSTFMNDPLTAHEMYQKEIEEVRMQELKKHKKKIDSLEQEVKRLNKVVEGARNGQKKIDQKYRQSQYHVQALQKKLEEV